MNWIKVKGGAVKTFIERQWIFVDFIFKVFKFHLLRLNMLDELTDEIP